LAFKDKKGNMKIFTKVIRMYANQLTRKRVPRFTTGLTGHEAILYRENRRISGSPPGVPPPDIFSLQKMKHTKLWVTRAQNADRGDSFFTQINHAVVVCNRTPRLYGELI
jgi:hypothetical protein